MKYVLNEENMNEVMEKINIFFSLPTHENVGIRNVRKGTKVVGFTDKEIRVPNYVEQETFLAYPGNCREHCLRQEKKEQLNKGFSFVTQEDVDKLMLSIQNDFCESCYCLSKNSLITIDEFELAIVLSNDLSKDKTKNFIHLKSEYDDFDLLYIKREKILAEFYNLTDSYVWEGIGQGYCEMNSINNEIIESVTSWLYNIENLEDLKDTTISKKVNILSETIVVDIVINLGKYEITFISDNKAFISSTDVIDYYMNKFFNNNNPFDDEYDSYCDYDDFFENEN